MVLTIIAMVAGMFATAYWVTYIATKAYYDAKPTSLEDKLIQHMIERSHDCDCPDCRKVKDAQV